jgi:hypothetical protein
MFSLLFKIESLPKTLNNLNLLNKYSNSYVMATCLHHPKVCLDTSCCQILSIFGDIFTANYCTTFQKIWPIIKALQNLHVGWLTSLT